MRFRPLILGAVGLTALGLCGCTNAPGRPGPGEMPVVPREISDFSNLYEQNCSGCHGPEGKGGAAIALADPVYLAIADDAILRHAATNGIRGTSMPAFAQSAGGMLTAKQIDVIVSGIRERWSKTDEFRGADPPPYSSSTPGVSARGSEVYATYCSSCHGAGGPELGAPDWRGNIPGSPMSAQDVSDVVAWLASQRPTFPGQPFPATAKLTGDLR